MKFDSFVKYAGSDGAILTAPDSSKWLFFNGIGMEIPEYKNVCGRVGDMPAYVSDLIYESDFDLVELTGAHVPCADSKPSELLRDFNGRMNYISVTNKAFGFIEKKDSVFMAQTEYIDDNGDLESYKALLVTRGYCDSDYAEFKMIILEKVED